MTHSEISRSTPLFNYCTPLVQPFGSTKGFNQLATQRGVVRAPLRRRRRRPWPCDELNSSDIGTRAEPSAAYPKVGTGARKGALSRGAVQVEKER